MNIYMRIFEETVEATLIIIFWVVVYNICNKLSPNYISEFIEVSVVILIDTRMILKIFLHERYSTQQKD